MTTAALTWTVRSVSGPPRRLWSTYTTTSPSASGRSVVGLRRNQAGRSACSASNNVDAVATRLSSSSVTTSLERVGAGSCAAAWPAAPPHPPNASAATTASGRGVDRAYIASSCGGWCIDLTRRGARERVCLESRRIAPADPRGGDAVLDRRCGVQAVRLHGLASRRPARRRGGGRGARHGAGGAPRLDLARGAGGRGIRRHDHPLRPGEQAHDRGQRGVPGGCEPALHLGARTLAVARARAAWRPLGSGGCGAAGGALILGATVVRILAEARERRAGVAA